MSIKQGDRVIDKLVWSTCNVNCGSRCPVRVAVKDGRVVRVSADDSGDVTFGSHEIRACLRGRALREWLYSPERLTRPLKRVGRRGESRFRPISWAEALDTIAAELQRIIDRYGNAAVYRNYGSGNLGGVVSSYRMLDRLMNCLGGKLDYYNSYSTAQITHAMHYTYGENETGNHLGDIVNSRLVVFFGNNPAETRMSGGGLVYDLTVVRQAGGAKTIVIDPRHTDTAACFADEWIPIRPGTDAALASALAHILINEEMIDNAFLKRYCQGYDPTTMPAGVPSGNSYRDYILGTGPDATPKTPAWAEAITGIPRTRIIRLAREIGQAKPAYIAQGWGPQRHANGEQSARAIAMLAILTGNVGIRGGNTGDREAPHGIAWPEVPVGENPVKAAIPTFLWTRAITEPSGFTDVACGLRGARRLEVPIKFIWNFASNMLINQHSDINRTAAILADETACETIVVIDNVMTASARHADIVLPGAATFEESDLAYQGYAVEMGALMMREKAVEPLGESRTLFDICAGLARRMGVEDRFTEGRTHDGWVEHMYQQCRRLKPELPEAIGQAFSTGVFKWRRSGPPKVGLARFRQDPEHFPLQTPSGKIEIFSTRLWKMSHTWALPDGDVIRALPEYVPTWGLPSDPQSSAYPLQCIGHHTKQRTHSSYGNNAWLNEVVLQMLWINPLDAAERGIRHNDPVLVFNPHGSSRVRAKVTPRIMPGVVSLPQGAWHRPGQDGVDEGGCINMLTCQRPSPIAKGNPQHTNLVEVKRVGKQP
ncbi:MAG: DMSO/selenate family reductase complex A subunit [Desulfosarcina sp.]